MAQAKKVETTPEEVEGFQIVRSILRKEVAVGRIVARDAQTYFAILFDDNNRKPLCRLYLNGNKKYIAVFDESKNEVRKEISTIDDIFLHSDQLLLTLNSYLPKNEIKQAL